jgi:hypothetical protein
MEMTLTRSDKLLIHVSNVAVTASGVVYAWMLYLLEPVDEFSILNHPWQDHMRNLHLWFAPLLVFACALVWKSHVWERLRTGRKRRRNSGLAMVVCLFPMIFSGYLLQTAVDESWRLSWLYLHWVSSALWLLASLVHFVPVMIKACVGASR